MFEFDPRFYRLIAHLHRGGQYAHLWTKDKNGKQSHWFETCTRPVLAPAFFEHSDVYFSVNPVTDRAERSIHTKTHKSDIAAINCLWAEFDDVDFSDNAAGYASTLTPAPSVTVHSGGGVHAYWLLHESFVIADEDDRARADSIQKRWSALKQGDKGVNDLARVLRVPSTLNHKYKPARPVEFKLWQPDRLYYLIELEVLLPPAPVVNTVVLPAQPNNVADQDLLAMAEKASNGAKFQRLWAGDFQRYYASDHSTADLALCTTLAFWTGRDAARIDRLFRQSGLFRPEKWDRRDYRERTIEKACSTVFDTYTPGMDSDAVQAAMAAVGLVKTHVNGHGPTTATAPVQTTQPPPPLTQHLVDLIPDVGKLLRDRMYREDKVKLSSLLIDFFERNKQLFYDDDGGLCYLQDEHHQIWPITGEKEAAGLRRYLRSVGLNSTEYMFHFLLEEISMAAMQYPTQLHQNMFWQNGALYIPCGGSFLVKATIAGLEKLPNGTDNVYFIANSALPEWQPVALDDAEHPLSLKAMQIAINAPADATGYTADVQQILLSAWLVAFMAGIRPLPLLATLGNKGGGKSMLLRSILKLIMGANNDLTPLTADKRDYDTMVVNELLVGLDNVDQLPAGSEWFFDSLATTATGGINKRRQFHTLATMVKMQIVAAVMVSSRTASFARPDVAERTLPIFVRPFNDDEREPDSALLGALSQHRDAVLSWMAYHAVNVLERRAKAPRGLPARFQDFAHVVWAYCAACGQEAQIIDILQAWRNAQSMAVGDADPLMRAIVEYINEDDSGFGLVDLNAKEMIDKLKLSGADLPYLGGGKVVAQRLRELKNVLAALGVKLEERIVKQRARFTIQQI